MNDDSISRQAAIDAIEFGITYARAINKETGEVKELFQEGNNELRKAAERVKALPSVTSEKLVAKISFDDEKLKEIAAKAAEEIKEELLITEFSGNDRTITATKAAPNVPTMPPVYTVSADDVIENMEAELELCNKVLDDVNISGTAHIIYNRVAEMLREQIDFVKELPQVEPEPRKGEWVWDANERCHCSECNYYRQLQIPEPDDYCPKCGAKMEGEANEWDAKEVKR